MFKHILTQRQVERDAQKEGMKQIKGQLTPFTAVDIPQTARELKQLRHTTPGGAFDVYPPFQPQRVGDTSSEKEGEECFHSLLLKSLSKPAGFISQRIFYQVP